MKARQHLGQNPLIVVIKSCLLI